MRLLERVRHKIVLLVAKPELRELAEANERIGDLNRRVFSLERAATPINLDRESVRQDGEQMVAAVLIAAGLQKITVGPAALQRAGRSTIQRYESAFDDTVTFSL